MTVFAFMMAWLIEQLYPLHLVSLPHRLRRRWARWVALNVDTGQRSHAQMGWLAVVVVPPVLAAAVHWGLAKWLGAFAAMVWDALMLYLCMGWRRFTGQFMAIRNALADAEDWRARQLLAAWQGVEVDRLPETDISRHAIEYALLTAHRHTFAVLFWYAASVILGLAPLLALIYCNADMARQYFRMRQQVLALPEGELLAEVSERAWQWLDWLPARASALVLAVVGNFVPAMRCYRVRAEDSPWDGDGLLLASASGALNLRLGGRAVSAGRPFIDSWDEEPIAAVQITGSADARDEWGRDAEVPRMGEVMHRLWRALGVWLLAVLLMSLLGLL